MQASVTSDGFSLSRIKIVQFINLDPNKLETIYTAFSFANDQMAKLSPVSHVGKKVQATFTFDQPLFSKADDICLAKSMELDRIFSSMSGFHTLMSFMGGLGFIMKCSGLEDLL